MDPDKATHQIGGPMPCPGFLRWGDMHWSHEYADHVVERIRQKLHEAIDAGWEIGLLCEIDLIDDTAPGDTCRSHAPGRGFTWTFEARHPDDGPLTVDGEG